MSGRTRRLNLGVTLFSAERKDEAKPTYFSVLQPMGGTHQGTQWFPRAGEAWGTQMTRALLATLGPLGLVVVEPDLELRRSEALGATVEL